MKFLLLIGMKIVKLVNAQAQSAFGMDGGKCRRVFRTSLTFKRNFHLKLCLMIWLTGKHWDMLGFHPGICCFWCIDVSSWMGLEADSMKGLGSLIDSISKGVGTGDVTTDMGNLMQSLIGQSTCCYLWFLICTLIDWQNGLFILFHCWQWNFMVSELPFLFPVIKIND